MKFEGRGEIMKVFISWSGARSNQVANLLSSWLKCVLQASKPWISSDMDRGIVWFNTINEALADTNTGIICLTADNLNSPWILFETGSLSNGLTDKRVCTFLIDVKPADVEPPLSQFNHTEPNRNSMLNLIKTINGRLGDKQLDTETLQTVFDTYYPQFEKQFSEIISKTEAGKGDSTKNVVIRSEQEMLEEVLVTVRNLNQRVGRIEKSSSIRSSRPLGKRYIVKEDIIRNMLNEYEPEFVHIVKDGKDKDFLNNILEKISKDNDLPLPMARDIVRECIQIKEQEYQEYLADAMRG